MPRGEVFDEAAITTVEEAQLLAEGDAREVPRASSTSHCSGYHDEADANRQRKKYMLMKG